METSSSSGLLLPSTRKRKPVRKYGEFAFNDELGDESADSLCEFFSRRSYNDNVGPKRKKEAVEHGFFE